VKKLLLCSILGLFSTAQSAEIEWEWVRAFKVMIDPDASCPHTTVETMAFHFSKTGLKEALEDKYQHEILVQLYKLHKKDIQKLYKGIIPEQFKDHLVEFGIGDSDDTCKILISNISKGN
jgi:hypothetical protein